LVWVWKISPKNTKFSIFGSGQKVPEPEAGWPLIYCRSKVCSGWIGSRSISNLGAFSKFRSKVQGRCFEVLEAEGNKLVWEWEEIVKSMKEFG